MSYSRVQLKKLETSIATIRSIARVFQNAATRKMKINQEEIAKIDQYVKEAAEIYFVSKKAALATKNIQLAEAVLTAPVRKASKKRVLVLISSESRYYGSLIAGLFDRFLSEFARGDADGFILGGIGRELFEENPVGRRRDLSKNVTFLSFDDDNPDFSSVGGIIKKLVQYSQIVVFYGQYESVFRQDAKVVELGGSIAPIASIDKKKYLFRPNALSALVFLEEQFIAGKFLAKLYESGLAKYGYRVKILQIGQVAQRISQALDELSKSKLAFSKISKNKKQSQLFSGSRLWTGDQIVSVY